MVFVPGGGGVSGAVPPSTNYTTICSRRFATQSTIHPAIGADTDPAVHSIEYNLGWNWDLILGSGDEIAWTITTDKCATRIVRYRGWHHEQRQCGA